MMNIISLFEQKNMIELFLNVFAWSPFVFTLQIKSDDRARDRFPILIIFLMG